MKNSIVLATAVAAVLTSGIASADLSANAGVFSNYIWRGVSQTSDQAAGQGGIDWGTDGGLYAGTWVSNVSGGYETDVYAGFATDFFDVGVITYQYPVTPGVNFTELYVSGSLAGFTAGVALTVDKAGDADDTDDIYLHANYDFTASDIDYSLYLGNYTLDSDPTGDSDYSHFGASLSKDGFTFAVDKNDTDQGTGFGFNTNSDAVRFTASYSVDFEL